jgi:serine/threonine-protein kinase
VGEDPVAPTRALQLEALDTPIGALYNRGMRGPARSTSDGASSQRRAPVTSPPSTVADLADPDSSDAMPTRADGSPPTVDDDAWSVGAALRPGHMIDGRYRVERVIGAGGMGQVVEALHVELQRRVAVKVLHAEWARDEDSALRFVREARVVAKLTNEHVVRIFDLGRTPDGAPYIVMERLDGKDLGAVIEERKPIAIGDAVEWLAQASEALVEAHDNGIVHRDVKPQNLFLTNDGAGRSIVKVLDFGLAKSLQLVSPVSDASKLTGAHMLLGSPHFMSPEQLRDARSVDLRTDVWSLGATLYHVLVGEQPFAAKNLHSLCAAILTGPIPSVRAARPDAPPELEAVIVRCLSRAREHRYPSARALAAELRGILDRGSVPVIGTAPLLGPLSAAPTPLMRDRQVSPADPQRPDGAGSMGTPPYDFEPTEIARVESYAGASAAPKPAFAATALSPLFRMEGPVAGSSAVPNTRPGRGRLVVLLLAGAASLATGIALSIARPPATVFTAPNSGSGPQAARPASGATSVAAPDLAGPLRSDDAPTTASSAPAEAATPTPSDVRTTTPGHPPTAPTTYALGAPTSAKKNRSPVAPSTSTATPVPTLRAEPTPTPNTEDPFGRQ